MSVGGAIRSLPKRTAEQTRQGILRFLVVAAMLLAFLFLLGVVLSLGN